jgi:hypothetical protein
MTHQEKRERQLEYAIAALRDRDPAKAEELRVGLAQMRAAKENLRVLLAAWVHGWNRRPTIEEILAGLARANASQEWACEDDIPYLADWLNSRGWEKQYTPAARA